MADRGASLAGVERPRSQTVLRPVAAKGFVVLPKRWIVERIFAWIARCRGNNRDHEKTTASSEAFVHLATIRIMAKRLA